MEQHNTDLTAELSEREEDMVGARAADQQLMLRISSSGASGMATTYRSVTPVDPTHSGGDLDGLNGEGTFIRLKSSLA
ncbi:hypothetical protein [Streptomyces sp. NPDC127119]|uniref:hypothetical protein n=1 Tax=Streptomyces sp. NPDC127119 TaxID=3345370 RepID=UPI00363BDFF5